MAKQQYIDTTYADGTRVLSNIRDSNTDEVYSLKNTSEYADGTPMDDSKVDGDIYRKLGDTYFIRSMDLTKSRTLVVDSVEDLRNLSLRNQLLIRLGYYDKVETKGYYEDGDGGGIEYIINFSTSGIDDGFLIIKPTTNTLGIQFNPNIKDSINIKIAGAISDTVFDNSPILQKVFNYALSSRYRTVYIPSDATGSYGIGSTIMINSGSNLNVKGDGRSLSSTLRVLNTVLETEPIQSVLQFFGATSMLNFQDLTIDMNNRALNGIYRDEGFNGGISYSTYNRLTFRNIRYDGYGLNGVTWSSTITQCDFLGYGTNGNPSEWEGTGIRILGGSNGVNIVENNIRRLSIGIFCADSALSVNIKNNVFDYIKQSAAQFLNGVQAVSFEGNYLESVGGTPSEVRLSDGTSRLINSNLIFSHAPTSTRVTVKSLTIKGNTFFNNASTDIIALNSSLNTVIENNTVTPNPILGQYAAESFVKLYGLGTIVADSYSNTEALLIQNNYFKASPTSGETVPYSVNRVLAWGDLQSPLFRALKKIVVKDNNKYYRPNFPTNLIHSNPIQRWPLQFTKLREEGENVVYKFIDTGGAREIQLFDAITVEKLKGTYVRLTYTSKSIIGNNPVNIILDDGVSTSNSLSLGTSSEVNQDTIFYVDDNATKLSYVVDIATAGTGQEAEISNLQITSASNDYTLYKEITKDIYLPSAPTLVGNWDNDDVIYNSLFNGTNNRGWVWNGTDWVAFLNQTPDSSETVKGIIEIATQAETNTGTDDLRAVTPLKLETKLSQGALTNPVPSDISPLVENASVTYDQVQMENVLQKLDELVLDYMSMKIRYEEAMTKLAQVVLK